MWEGSGNKPTKSGKMKKLGSSSILVVCFIGFIVNLDLEDTGVARYTKTGKPVPKSGSAGAAGRQDPERPDGPESD